MICMNKNALQKLIKVIVEQTQNEIGEMWMSTNEAGLTSEKKELLKGYIKKCVEEYMEENQ